jgi:hypothetical protein
VSRVVRSSGIAVVAAGGLRAVCASCKMRDGAATIEVLGELSGALRGAEGSGVLEGST